MVYHCYDCKLSFAGHVPECLAIVPCGGERKACTLELIEEQENTVSEELESWRQRESML